MEVMVCVDEFFAELTHGRTGSACLYLATAYENLIEVTVILQPLVSGVTVNARQAANQSHDVHRKLKKVWEWCSNHRSEFKSRNKAAEAVVWKARLANVTVPTAVKWIKEWERDTPCCRCGKLIYQIY
jgi:hypothetical protein